MTISIYCQHEAEQATLSLHDLNGLLDSLTAEHVPYLDGLLTDWYGQIVNIVLLPNGLPALQATLDCPQCDAFSQTVYAIPGEHGAWATLLEADGTFLADLCDADERNQALICEKCKERQTQTALLDMLKSA
ncbi:MAG: hypothetical protein ACRDHZ_00270 [Ktedonobacteraceae bacterium]